MMGEYDDLIAATGGKASGAKGEYDDLIAAATPSLWDRAKASAGRAKDTFLGGARAVGETVAHPVDTLKDPARRRQLERGLDDMLTLGHGQRLAARIGNALGDTPDVAIGPETFGGGVTGSGGTPVAKTQTGDQSAAPEFRQLGNVAGVVAPGAASAAAKGGMQLARALGPEVVDGSKALTALLGAGRGTAGYLLSAPATAALSAGAEGDRVGAARDVATDPFGIGMAALGGAASAGAEARVKDRIVKDVPHGEATAKLSTAKKFSARIGEDGEHLDSLLARDPKLEAALAKNASGQPAKVAKIAQDRIERISGETNAMYDVIGDVDISGLDGAFAKLRESAVREGRIEAVGPIDRARGALAGAYGKDGVIPPGTALPAKSVRNFANGIGEAAFSGDATAPVKTRIRSQRDLYRIVTGAIEDAADKAPGVDVAKLKQANRDMSILIPMRDALKERGAKETVGRTSLYSLLKGNVKGTITGEGKNAAGAAVRRIDYKLMQDARKHGGTAAAARALLLARRGGEEPQSGDGLIE